MSRVRSKNRGNAQPVPYRPNAPAAVPEAAAPVINKLLVCISVIGIFSHKPHKIIGKDKPYLNDWTSIRRIARVV